MYINVNQNRDISLESPATARAFLLKTLLIMDLMFDFDRKAERIHFGTFFILFTLDE